MIRNINLQVEDNTQSFNSFVLWESTLNESFPWFISLYAWPIFKLHLRRDVNIYIYTKYKRIYYTQS